MVLPENLCSPTMFTDNWMLPHSACQEGLSSHSAHGEHHAHHAVLTDAGVLTRQFSLDVELMIAGLLTQFSLIAVVLLTE